MNLTTLFLADAVTGPGIGILEPASIIDAGQKKGEVMLKHRLLFLLLVFAVGLGAVTQSDQFVTPDQKDYQDVKDMRSRFGGEPLPAGGSSRGDLVLAMAGLATDAATLAPTGDWKTQDYDALYSLLQKYRDELRAMGFSQKQLEDELAALKV